VTVHELDNVYENHRSIWMTVAANRRRIRRRIHAGGILHGRKPHAAKKSGCIQGMLWDEMASWEK